MKRTFFRNSLIFSGLIVFIVTFMTIGHAALQKDLSITSSVTLTQGLLRPNSGTPSKFLGCDNIPTSSVKKLYFRASFPDTAVETCDVSDAQDGSVMAYLKSNGTVYVVAQGGVVYANTATKLSYLTNCSYISFVDTGGVNRFNTKNMTSMYRMFDSLCSTSTCKMDKLDLSSFDTSKVTNMDGTFVDASHVCEFDVSSFNTSKVVSMNEMFKHCSSILYLNVSSFDTSRVYDMNYMFGYNPLLVDVYIGSQWSTANLGNGPASECNASWGCSGAGMLDGSNMAYYGNGHVEGRHPYGPCSVQGAVDITNYNGVNYAKLDGGSSSPGCFSDVSTMSSTLPTYRATTDICYQDN